MPSRVRAPFFAEPPPLHDQIRSVVLSLGTAFRERPSLSRTTIFLYFSPPLPAFSPLSPSPSPPPSSSSPSSDDDDSGEDESPRRSQEAANRAI